MDAREKAIAKLKGLTLEQLLDAWEQTTTCNDPNVYTVRGWIMDELERREPEAFDAWLDKEPAPEDSELRIIAECFAARGGKRIKDGWHVLHGHDVYVEDGMILRAFKDGQRASVYKSSASGGYDNACPVKYETVCRSYGDRYIIR